MTGFHQQRLSWGKSKESTWISDWNEGLQGAAARGMPVTQGGFDGQGPLE